LTDTVDCGLNGLKNVPLAEAVKSRLHLLTGFDLVSIIENTCSMCPHKSDCSNHEKIKRSKIELRSKCVQIRQKVRKNRQA